jgi:RND family efflux transporter MFP subunit
MTTPKLRGDLKAAPAEEQGIRYYDVSDPKSGSRMRLYDFEWLIAERMDGETRFADVASWARQSLGVNPSATDLEEYAARLRDLGFFEVEAAKPLRIDSDYTPLPPASPMEVSESSEVSIETDEPTVPEMAKPELPVEVEPPALAPAPVPPAPVPMAVKPPEPVRPMRREELRVRDETRSTGKVPAGPSTMAAMQAAGVGGDKKSSSASIIGLVLLMLGIAGAVGYLKFFKPNVAHVTVVVASPREVVRLHDGAGAVKKANAQVLSFGEAGKVTDVVAKGTEVKAGMPLATLDAYAQVEKALADVKDRASFYQKKLEAAKAKNDEPGIKENEAKVAEKHKLLAELEARAAKVRLTAPGSGTVSDVLVTAGGDVKPGEPAIKLGDKRMSADFNVPAGEAPKTGEAVMLQAAGGGATFGGKVISSQGGTVVVEVPEGAPVKTGDSLRLVKKREQNVIQIPGTALVKRDGVDEVFVLTKDGEAHARKVTVADKSGADVLVTSGLAAGDSVITTGADTLQEGQKAATQ